MVQDDQSPFLASEVEEQEAQKEVANSHEKPVNSEPQSLFIDGYRASTQTTPPPWATSRRGHVAHSKQPKVVP